MKDFSWWLRWTRVIGGFSALQAVVLLLNGLTGFLLVRSMDKEEYAWFTLVGSVLATIGILTDSGLSSAMSSIGGPICQDKPRFAELMALTKRLRFAFMGLSMVVALPAGIYLLHLNHAPAWTAFALILTIVASAIPAAEIAMLGAANRLHARLRQILQADSSMSLTRLVLVFFGRYAGMGAVLASLITALSQWLQLLLLRRQTRSLTQVPHADTGSFRAPMLEVVKHMLPMCVFQCVQGQITTWILGIFASTSTVADVGALTRFGIILTFLFVPLQNIVLPKIACITEPSRLCKLCVATIAVALLFSVMMVVLGVTFSNTILWLLGPQYSHLHTELAFYLVQLAITCLSQSIMSIAMTRGWVRQGWLHIPLTIFAQAAGAMVLDLSKATHAIMFATISSVTGLMIAMFLVSRGLATMRRQITRV